MNLLNSDMLQLLLSEEGKIQGIDPSNSLEVGLVVELRLIWLVDRNEEKMKVVRRVVASRLLGSHRRGKLDGRGDSANSQGFRATSIWTRGVSSQRRSRVSFPLQHRD
jgi:hypothetical protein